MHYVIGDIHGSYLEMMKLLHNIESQDSDAVIYFLGDFIDRGPDVLKVLSWAMEHITPDGKYRAVRGNHEDMVIEWYKSLENNRIDGASELPTLHYGFDSVLKEGGLFTEEKIKEIADFFASLPLYINEQVTSPAGGR